MVNLLVLHSEVQFSSSILVIEFTFMTAFVFQQYS
jgi:hypothetical protein